MMHDKNYYRHLNLSQTASPDEIKKALHREFRTWTLRVNAAKLEDRQEAERMVKLLEEAESILLDPARRTAYDKELGFQWNEIPWKQKRETPAGQTVAPAPPPPPVDPWRLSPRSTILAVVGAAIGGVAGYFAGAIAGQTIVFLIVWMVIDKPAANIASMITEFLAAAVGGIMGALTLDDKFGQIANWRPKPLHFVIGVAVPATVLIILSSTYKRDTAQGEWEAAQKNPPNSMACTGYILFDAPPKRWAYEDQEKEWADKYGNYHAYSSRGPGDGNWIKVDIGYCRWGPDSGWNGGMTVEWTTLSYNKYGNLEPSGVLRWENVLFSQFVRLYAAAEAAARAGIGPKLMGENVLFQSPYQATGVTAGFELLPLYN